MEEPEEVIPPNKNAVMQELIRVDGRVIATAAGKICHFFGWNFRYTRPVTKPRTIPTGA